MITLTHKRDQSGTVGLELAPIGDQLVCQGPVRRLCNHSRGCPPHHRGKLSGRVHYLKVLDDLFRRVIDTQQGVGRSRVGRQEVGCGWRPQRNR
jgi:hypothetical protein